MANTRFGNFKDLAGDRKPITAKEAWDAFNGLGYMAQAFIPGATSIQRLIEGKPKEAVEELQDWIPGNAAYQNWLHDRPQDWERNVIDALIMGKPVLKGAKKAAEMVERIPKGSKEGYLRLKKPIQEITSKDIAEAANLNESQLKAYNEYNDKINIILDSKNPVTIKKQAVEDADRIISKMDPQTKEAAASLNTVETTKMHMQMNEYAPMKPAGFDEWPPEKRIEHLKKAFPEYSLDEIANVNRRDHSRAGVGTDQGPIFDDILVANDVTRALSDQKAIKEQKALKDATEKAERKAREQAEKEAKWKAEREAAAKLAEEKRLAKEAEQQRLAAEIEQQRLAEEAEAKRLAAEEERRAAEEAEFERQFREEEAAERNRYADSIGTALGREMAERDVDDWLFDKLVEEESRKNNPVSTMDVFTGESFGGTPTAGSTGVKSTKTRPTYDHSREFNGGNFQRLDPINRGTLKGKGDMGERIFDAQSKFYTPAANPGEQINSMSTGRKFSEGFPMTPARDPYNEAGVINDLNVKLNNIIDMERKRGLSDAEIYRKHKPEFDEYQGKLERYNYRLNNPSSTFNYDGALTNSIVATPSEEMNVLRNLGLVGNVDKRMGNIYDDVRDHYKSLMERIFDYESKFPQSPRLSNEQLVRLKDMGVKPEEIDIFLAEHPEFMLQ